MRRILRLLVCCLIVVFCGDAFSAMLVFNENMDGAWQGYEPVEYIQANGYEWTELDGYEFNPYTSQVVIDAAVNGNYLNSSTETYLMSIDKTPYGAADGGFGLAGWNAAGKFSAHPGVATAFSTAKNSNPHVFAMSGSTVSIVDLNVSTSFSTSMINSGGAGWGEHFRLFKNRSGDMSTGKIYWIYVNDYGRGYLYFPVKRSSDGVCGIYEPVSRKFYTSKNSSYNFVCPSGETIPSYAFFRSCSSGQKWDGTKCIACSASENCPGVSTIPNLSKLVEYDNGYTVDVTTMPYWQGYGVGTCTTQCSTMSNTTSTKEEVTNCTITHGVGSRTNVLQCNGTYQTGCYSAGETCEGCSSWRTISTGTCYVASCNGGYSPNAGVQATACNPNTYSIEYVLNGGTHGSSHPTSAAYDTQFTVDNPTRTGYTFAGWKITGMNSVTHTYGSSTTTSTSISSTTATTFKNLHSISGATVTFTAQWTAKTYTVTYAAGTGGSGSISSATATYNSNFTPATPSSSTITKANATFAGWTVSGTSDTKSAGSAFKWTYTENKTFTATWTCNAGYYLNGTACSPCGAGKYKAAGNATSCSDVTAGYYNTGCGTNATGGVCSSSYSGGTIAAGYYGGAGAKSSTGSGKVSAGYYSSGGGTSATPTAAGNGCISSKSCGGCSGRNSYSGAGASSCSAPGDGYYTTGCTGTDKCTGRSQCTSGNYCKNGVSTACTTTSGWTTASAAGSSAYTACYQTRVPSNCNAGNTKRTASSISGTTITYGSESVDVALGASAGYYVNSLVCSACGGNNYYCAGGTAARKTVSSGYYSTGGDANTRTGQSQCTAGYYCSSGVRNACAGGKYSSSAGATSCSNITAGYYCAGGSKTATPSSTSDSVTGASCGGCSGRNSYSGAGASSCSAPGDGYYTTGCNSSNNLCTGRSQCTSGNYCKNGVSTACTTTSGWTTASAAGSSAYTACYQTQTPANCSSGTIKRTASSINGTTITYGSATVTSALSAEPGSIVDGQTCTQCSAGYYSAGGTATSCGNCASANGANGRPQYSGAGASSCTECPAATGTYASRVTSYSGWWSNDIHNTLGGCYANFADSDSNATFRTMCYYSPTDGTYGGANSSCQIYAPSACAAGYYSTISSRSEWFSERGYAGCKGVDCMKDKVCTAVENGYYSPADATTQTACSSLGAFYTKSDSGRGASTDCYGTTTAGNYLKTAKDATESTCAAGGYCPGSVDVHYNSVGGRTACSSLSGVSVAGGEYTSAAGSNANTACKYTAPNKTITGCKTVTSQAVTYNGSAWPASTYGVTASKGYVIANNNKSNATCSACGTGTYQATDGSTATSCSLCSSLTAPTVTDGTYTTNPTSGATANTACRYKAPDISTPANCSGVTTNTVSYDGSAWGTDFYTVTSVSGNYITSNNNANPKCAACDSNYPSSAANSTKAGQCYLTLIAGKQVATAGAGASSCATNSYCTSTSKIYYNTDGGTATYTGSTCSSGTNGKYTKSAAGSDEVGDCGRILHLGDNVLYLRSVQKTTPSLKFDTNNDGTPDLFGNMSTTSHKMSAGATKSYKTTYNGLTYYIYDDSAQ